MLLNDDKKQDIQMLRDIPIPVEDRIYKLSKKEFDYPESKIEQHFGDEIHNPFKGE